MSSARDVADRISRVRGLRLRIDALRAELRTTTGNAARNCVRESLLDAARQLHETLQPRTGVDWNDSLKCL